MNKRQLEVQKVQIDNELKVLKELKKVYTQASKDCAAKISELSSRTDMENIQSIVYQKKYQEAIKKQIDAVLDTLQSNSFTTISDYLGTSYENGFFGTLYDLQGQGIPLCFPINQEQVVQALQLDSKISKGLYTRLGEDVSKLKKSITAEISRDAVTGVSWNEIAGKLAKGMNGPFSKAYNNSIRIVRTEGHRIQAESTYHCQQKAKSKGADVVKQWDSTLDGVTRPSHKALNGQIREVEEPFEGDGGKAMYPGGFGTPSEDCNCRCCLLQRARWAISNEEYYTKWNGDKNELVKIPAKSYNDFKDTAKQVIKSGALDSESEAASEHAIKYYGLVRKMNTDVSKIASNTNISIEKIEIAKNHLFMEKHDLGNGELEYFSPDYEIAQSWQRLMEGSNIKEQDLILIQHETYEASLMKKGLSQAEAHSIASKKYNYALAVKKGR